MSSKKIAVVLADVDGTLVNSGKLITDHTKVALRKLAAAGIKFPWQAHALRVEWR